MDGGEYLVPLCSSAPHHGRHFIEPIHVTISIIYQILARLWAQVIIKRRSICTIFFFLGENINKRKNASRWEWGGEAHAGCSSIWMALLWTVVTNPSSKVDDDIGVVVWFFEIAAFLQFFFYFIILFFFTVASCWTVCRARGEMGWDQVKKKKKKLNTSNEQNCETNINKPLFAHFIYKSIKVRTKENLISLHHLHLCNTSPTPDNSVYCLCLQLKTLFFFVFISH